MKKTSSQARSHKNPIFNVRSAKLAQDVKSGKRVRNREVAEVIAECLRAGELMDPDFGQYLIDLLLQASSQEAGGPLIDRRGRPRIDPIHQQLKAFLFNSRIEYWVAQYCKQKRIPRGAYGSKPPRGALKYAYEAMAAEMPGSSKRRQHTKPASVEQAHIEARKALERAARIVARETEPK